MSIRFNRESVQQAWQAQQQGVSSNVLGDAIADQNLSKAEYENLKAAYEAEHPGGDFDRWMADALDGQLDTRVNRELLSALKAMSREGSALSEISFTGSAQGFDGAVAERYQNRDWLSAVQAADSNADGRIAGAERRALRGELGGLGRRLQAENAVLTYETDSQSFTFYAAPDAPQLHGRYRDLKADIQLDLRDIDGISDLSAQDLRGHASGELSFDWRGPLVDGIKQAIHDKMGDWVEVNTSYIDENHEYGPGFLIQASSGPIATRPIVINANDNGELYVASPGFGETVRLWLAEKGLNDHVIPRLSQLGFELEIEQDDGKIFLRPQKMEMEHLPLSVTAEAQGELTLDLESRTRFSVRPDGVHAHFDRVQARGSSQAGATQARSDAGGPDRIQGRVQAGLNYDLSRRQLDTQVILDGVNTRLHLDREEIENLELLPGELKELAGDALLAEMTLHGSARHYQGNRYQGEVQGQISLTQREGEIVTDGFARFRTAGSSDTGLGAVTLSAVDLRRQNPTQEIRVQARSGRVEAPQASAPLRAELQNVRAEAELSGPILGRFRDMMSKAQPIRDQFVAALQELGVKEAELQTLSGGDSPELSRLLDSQAFVSKLERALLTVELEQLQLSSNEDAAGLDIDAQGLSFAGRLGNERDTEVQLQGQSERLSGRASGQEIALSAEHTQAEITAQSDRQGGGSDGRLSGSVRLASEQSELQIQMPQNNEDSAYSAADLAAASDVSLDFQGAQASGRVRAELNPGAAGAHVELQGELRSVNARVDAEGMRVEAGSVQGEMEYQSAQGSQWSIEGELRQFSFQQDGQGGWQLQTPDAELHQNLQLWLPELREIFAALNGESLDAVNTATGPDDLEHILNTAGFDKENTRKAIQLLWQPEVRQLLATSDFYDAVMASDKLEIQLQSAGEFSLQNQAEGLEFNAQGQHTLSTALQDDSGRVLADSQLSGQSEVEYREGELSLSSPEVTLTAQAYGLNGEAYAHFESRIAEIQAQHGELSRLETGEISGELVGNTTLDPEKLSEIRNLLSDFRDDLVKRLDALGLNREQFEHILKAFGQEQLQQLLEAATPEALAEVSADLGLSPDQIRQTLSLLNDEPFQNLVQDLFEYASILNNAQTEVRSAFRIDSSQSERNAQGTAFQLQNIVASISAQSENAAGQGRMQIEAQQERLNYTQTPEGQRLEGQRFDIQMQGELESSQSADDDAPLRHMRTHARLEGRSGALIQSGDEYRSRFRDVEASASLNHEEADGTQARMESSARLEALQTRRDSSQSGSGELAFTGLNVSGEGQMEDASTGQQVQGEGELSLSSGQIQHERLDLQGIGLEGEMQTQRELEEGRAARASARAQIHSEQAFSTAEDGVVIPEAAFSGELESTLERDNAMETRMRFAAENGRLEQLRAQSGQVAIDRLDSEVTADTHTPLVRGQIGGEMSVTGFRAENAESTAESFGVDSVNGRMFIDTERLRGILSSSPDALNILETISEHWATQQQRGEAPQLFLNDELILNITQGQWTGDASDGNALKEGQTVSARLNMPNLETRLGSGVMNIDLENITLAQSEARPEVQVKGNLEFQPRQPEFNQAVQSLVDFSLKEIGMNLKPEVYFENGEFRVKLDRWFVDGLVSLDFEGDNIEMKIDRAKLLHFISSRGLATDFAESKLNNFLLDIDQSDRTTLNLSLSEFSERLLHKDNLQIQSVQTRPDNSIGIEFAYTDSPEYNAGFRQRQQAKLDRLLFHDPRSGARRSDNQLEDVVEELENGRLARIFQQASPQQLRRILHAVGNDYDNIVRGAMAHTPRPTAYPVENRAIMAATLANNSGFFESVDREEKTHIRALVNSLEDRSQQQRFRQMITPAEWQDIQKRLDSAERQHRRAERWRRR